MNSETIEQACLNGAMLCLTCGRTFSEGHLYCPNDQTGLIRLAVVEGLPESLTAKGYKLIAKLDHTELLQSFAAEQVDSGRITAVKLLRPLNSEEGISRFTQTMADVGKLTHVGLLKIYDYGVIYGWQPYVITEFVKGETLQSIIKQGPLTPVHCLTIFSHIIEVLKYLHASGLMHGELSSDNILIEDSTQMPKLLNLGLVNYSWLVPRNPAYLSPEQCTGRACSPASDTYSLAVLLYEALTGQPPFRGNNVFQTAHMQLNSTPPDFAAVRPDLRLSNKLQAAVFRAMEKDPRQRFESVEEFRVALEEAISAPDANEGYLQEGELPAPAAQMIVQESLQTPAPQSTGSKVLPSGAALARSILLAAGLFTAGAFIGLALSPRTKVDVASEPHMQESVRQVAGEHGARPPKLVSVGATPAISTNPFSIAGTIYALSIEHLPNGSRLTGLSTSGDDEDSLFRRFSADLEYASHARLPEIGDRCHAFWEHGRIGALKVIGRDQNIEAVKQTLSEFLNCAAEERWVQASSLFVTAPPPDELREHWQGIKRYQADKGKSLDFSRAFKILLANNQVIEVLFDESSIGENRVAIDMFILAPDQRGNWKILCIEKRVARDIWHSI